MLRRGFSLPIRAPTLPHNTTQLGLLHMPPWKFAAVTLSCVLITAPMQLGVGYLIAQNFHFESTADLLFMLMAVIFGFIAMTVLFRIWRRHRRGREEPPRAKMAWLKRFRVPRRSKRDTKGREVL